MPERILSPESKPTSPPSPERLPIPESFELGKEERKAGQATEHHEPASQSPSPLPPTLPRREPDSLQREVESILSDGLEDAFRTMDPLTQKEFKEEGERTADEIRSLLAETKVKIHKLLKILTRWLRMIPGVSRLFVEQEAKIKTDRLLALRRRERNETERTSL